MGDKFDRVGRPRQGSDPLQTQIREMLLAGRIDRRRFLRLGAMFGVPGRMLAAALGIEALPPRAANAAFPLDTLRIGQLIPRTAIEPHAVTEPAGVAQLSVTGEYLCFNGADSGLVPVLAESWSPNADATIWTFKLRAGVKFHDGRQLTADDVVATFERLVDPESGSNALTVFSGYLSKGGARTTDPSTVQFHLDAAHGLFPYLVSSDTCNAIILPKDYTGDFESNFNATGPFRLEKFTQRSSATFVRNADYWGAKALPARLEYTFFSGAPALLAALKAGQIDVMQRLPAGLSAETANSPDIDIIAVPSSAHHQVHMRTDSGPFADPRVRRAVALCLDRSALMAKLIGGRGRPGNDSPFTPSNPFAGHGPPQRQRDVTEARRLMDAAGFDSGFDVKLTAEKSLESPDYARAIQDAVKDIGGRVSVEILEQGAYFAEGVYGKSPWLDSAFGITEFEHRGLPHEVLMASLSSTGAWNAARYKNPVYDRAVAAFVAASGIDARQQAAGEIEQILLADTPMIFAYFHDALAAVRKGVQGVTFTPFGHLLLAAASAT